jgi:hypothetical protein
VGDTTLERLTHDVSLVPVLAMEPSAYQEAAGLIEPQAIARLLAAADASVAAWLERAARPDGETLADLGALDGGFVFYVDGEAYVGPGCCCGVDSIVDWQLLARHRSSDPVTVWLGHDLWALRGSFDEAREAVLLLREADGDRSRLDQTRRLVGVHTFSFARAVAQARRDLEALAGRCEEVLAAHLPRWQARQAACALAGLGSV